MWERRELKKSSKKLLFDNLSVLILSSLVLFIVLGTFSMNVNFNIDSILNSIITKSDTLEIKPYIVNLGFFNYREMYLTKFIPTFIITFPLLFIIIIIQTMISIFISGPMKIGYNRLFLNGFRDKGVNFSEIFCSFRENNFVSVGLKLFLKNIYLIFWSLLFIIPGIIKTYQYFYVEYILCDNPDMSLKDAIALSKEMTNGEKFDLFILCLSFIPWIILSFLTFGLINFFLYPYFSGTIAKLYLLKIEDENINYKNYHADDIIIGE